MPTAQLPSKPHYPILDGLRGVAAILVVIFHLFEGRFPDMKVHPMPHGFLAVDFFFLLSGFVIGYAYDDRWEQMSIWGFFKRRLVRLHPMVVMAVIIGAVAFCFDSYTGGLAQTTITKFILAIVLSLALLPGPDIRGWGETHPIVGPFWSLMQEYIANIIYALIGRRLNKSGLWILVSISAAAVLGVCVWRGDIGTGWSFETLWIAVVRMMFPFFAGLLLFRTGKLIKVPGAFLLCSLLIAILFFIPRMPTDKLNGVYEAIAIIIGFPLIVSMGAGGEIKGWWYKLCKFCGDISYPLYIIHYPFIYIYTMWIYKAKPTNMEIFKVAVGLFFFFILLAYVLLRIYDMPVRAWLKKKVLDK